MAIAAAFSTGFDLKFYATFSGGDGGWRVTCNGWSMAVLPVTSPPGNRRSPQPRPCSTAGAVAVRLSARALTVIRPTFVHLKSNRSVGFPCDPIPP